MQKAAFRLLWYFSCLMCSLLPPNTSCFSLPALTPSFLLCLSLLSKGHVRSTVCRLGPNQPVSLILYAHPHIYTHTKTHTHFCCMSSPCDMFWYPYLCLFIGMMGGWGLHFADSLAVRSHYNEVPDVVLIELVRVNSGPVFSSTCTQ